MLALVDTDGNRHIDIHEFRELVQRKVRRRCRWTESPARPPHATTCTARSHRRLCRQCWSRGALTAQSVAEYWSDVTDHQHDVPLLDQVIAGGGVMVRGGMVVRQVLTARQVMMCVCMWLHTRARAH